VNRAQGRTCNRKKKEVARGAGERTRSVGNVRDGLGARDGVEPERSKLAWCKLVMEFFTQDGCRCMVHGDWMMLANREEAGVQAAQSKAGATSTDSS
jgi:hypothetical protein